MSAVIRNCVIGLQDPVAASAHLGTLILVDSRRGISEATDMPMLRAIAGSKDVDQRPGKFQVVLTKSDSISPRELQHVADQTHAFLRYEFKPISMLFPDVILATSARKKIGIEELRNLIFSLLPPDTNE
jgi:GTP-binding protein EngB required for normal cell division